MVEPMRSIRGRRSRTDLSASVFVDQVGKVRAMGYCLHGFSRERERIAPTGDFFDVHRSSHPAATLRTARWRAPKNAYRIVHNSSTRGTHDATSAIAGKAILQDDRWERCTANAGVPTR